MQWWDFCYMIFIDGGLWIFLLAAWLVLCFVLGGLVFIVELLRSEYKYYRWMKTVETSHTAAKNRVAAIKEVENGNSRNNTRVNRNSGSVISNAPLN